MKAVKKFIVLFVSVLFLMTLLSACQSNKLWAQFDPKDSDNGFETKLSKGIVNTSTVISPVPFTSSGNIARYSDTPAVNDAPLSHYEKLDSLDSRKTEIGRFFAVAQTMREFEDLQDKFSALHKQTCSEWIHSVSWCDFPFTDIQTRYTDDYFAENILILYYAVEGYSANVNWIESVAIEKGTLVIYVNRINTSGLVACVVGSFGFEVQAKKADIAALQNGKTTVDKTALVCTNVISPPDCITVWVQDKYLEKIKNESFTTNDFYHKNIAGVQYCYYDLEALNIKYGYIVIYLSEIGTKRANEMAKYFNRLKFVEEANIGHF